MTAPILAIDPGKFKSTACVDHAEGGAFAVSSFVTVRDALLRLLTQFSQVVVRHGTTPMRLRPHVVRRALNAIR